MTLPFDPTAAIHHARVLATSLRAQFALQKPIAELGEMRAAFDVMSGAAGAQLQAALRASYPNIGFAGQLAQLLRGTDGELEDRDAEAFPLERSWLLDPIDGAVQFLRAMPGWCVTLTCMEARAPLFVVVVDPLHDEIFHAIAGHGAFRNGAPLDPPVRSTADKPILATTHPPFNDDSNVAHRAGRALAAVLPHVGALRNLGPVSLQLAYVAAGRLDGFYEIGGDAFNCFGAALLVGEAGGFATDVDGVPYDLDATSIVAAHAPVHAAVVDWLRATG